MDQLKKLLLKLQMENRPVDIIYINNRDRITKRTIYIKRIDQDKVIAFCTLRDQNRTFDITNILAAQKGSRYIENQKRQSRSQSNVGEFKNDAARA